MDNSIFSTFAKMCEHLHVVPDENSRIWETWKCHHPINSTPEILAMDSGHRVDCMYVFCPLIDPDTRKSSIQ